MSDLIKNLDDLAEVIEDIRADILMHLLIEKTGDEVLRSFDQVVIDTYRERVAGYSEQHQQELAISFNRLVDQIPIEQRIETG